MIPFGFYGVLLIALALTPQIVKAVAHSNCRVGGGHVLIWASFLVTALYLWSLL